MNKDASKYTRWLSQIRKEMAEIKRDPELSGRGAPDPHPRTEGSARQFDC